MLEATVTPDRQLTLPDEAFRALGIGPGDVVVVTICGGTATLSRKDVDSSSSLAGLLPLGYYPPNYLNDERREGE